MRYRAPRSPAVRGHPSAHPARDTASTEYSQAGRCRRQCRVSRRGPRCRAVAASCTVARGADPDRKRYPAPSTRARGPPPRGRISPPTRRNIRSTAVSATTDHQIWGGSSAARAHAHLGRVEYRPCPSSWQAPSTSLASMESERPIAREDEQRRDRPGGVLQCPRAVKERPSPATSGRRSGRLTVLRSAVRTERAAPIALRNSSGTAPAGPWSVEGDDLRARRVLADREREGVPVEESGRPDEGRDGTVARLTEPATSSARTDPTVGCPAATVHGRVEQRAERDDGGEREEQPALTCRGTPGTRRRSVRRRPRPAWTARTRRRHAARRRPPRWRARHRAGCPRAGVIAFTPSASSRTST